MTYEQIDAAKQDEHAFAARFGFYRRQCWYIDRIIVNHGNYYRYTTIGRNNHCGGEEFCWRVPNINNNAYAFALKLVR
jgi:hypothetical protein